MSGLEESKTAEIVLPSRNIPVVLIVQEAMHRFEELVGARPESLLRV